MSETNAPKSKEKATKILHKPKAESVLIPTFVAARQVLTPAQQPVQPAGSDLLQRSGVAPAPQEELTQDSASLAQAATPSRRSADLSTVPARTTPAPARLLIQPSLTVNEAGDAYEQEADQTAETVMQMPSTLSSAASPPPPGKGHPLAISRLSTDGSHGAFQAPAHVEAQISQMQGGGEALPDAEREFFETRMGYDFSAVRVHTSDNAIQASRDIQARAFTVGNHIAFNQGAYQPGSYAGRRLMAHELTHVAQQTGVRRSVEDDPNQNAGFSSPSLAMRSLLRSVAPSVLAVQRSVATSGGVWDTDQYDLARDVYGDGSPAPAAQGWRGLDITLKFTPAEVVDAESIGLTQSVQAFVNNAPNLTPAASTRAIPAGEARPANTGANETDEGTAIDRAAGYNNPIYPVASAASASLADTNTAAGWGQLGWRYTDATGALKTQDAKLIDAPRRANAAKDSRHIFEATAVATKGTQAGVYYGSIRWGWRTDSAGAFTKIPLEVVSTGAPSSSFMKAAAIWNQGKSSTGAANIQLPTADIKVTDAPLTLMPPIPRQNITLPVGTRLQVLEEWHPPLLVGTVVVVDGPNVGQQGTVSSEDWGKIKAERA